MALEVQIRKKLNSFTLDMNFTAGKGVFALLGASGCGKSVTLKCIAGIEKPDEGRIVLDGRVLFDSAKRINLPPQKRNVGYMFQDYALFPNMTVRQNVLAGMGRKPAPSEADPYLKRFRIAELAETYPAKLSGGQKQRVAMARLVAQKPELILLDEPFSALDTHLKWQLEQEMREILTGMDRPAVFVSHSRDEVYHLCDTVCSVSGGRAEVIEPVDEFFSNPKTRTAAILSGCKNVAEAEMLDPHTLRVPAWGLVLRVKREIPPDTAWAGIRAHYFRVPGKDETAGCISLKETAVIEDLFERTVLFRGGPEYGWLQWKVPKDGRELVLPERLAVDETALMLLRA